MKTSNATMPKGINEQPSRAHRAGAQDRHGSATLNPSASSSRSRSRRSAAAPSPASSPEPTPPDVDYGYDPQIFREDADRYQADPDFGTYRHATEAEERESLILALRTLADPAEQHELETEISAFADKMISLMSEKQRFEEELAIGVQQSGRLEGDGVLHRIRQELLELGLEGREDLTLEILEVEGLAYRIKGCWYSACDYARQIYIPARRRAKNAALAE